MVTYQIDRHTRKYIANILQWLKSSQDDTEVAPLLEIKYDDTSNTVINTELERTL